MPKNSLGLGSRLDLSPHRSVEEKLASLDGGIFHALFEKRLALTRGAAALFPSVARRSSGSRGRRWRNRPRIPARTKNQQ